MYSPTRSVFPVAIALTLLSFGASATAATTISASGDTVISIYNAAIFGGANAADTVNGDKDFLAAIGDNILSGTARTKSLVQFDLSAYLGQTVTGDATFSIFVGGVAGAGTSRNVAVHEVLIGWSEDTTTWNNFGADVGVDFGTDVEITPVDIVSYTPATQATSDTLNFTVPQAMIQSWIDTPATNQGLLINIQTGPDIYISSKENTDGNGPTLTFVAIPEPSSSLLVSGTLLLLATRRRR